MTNEPIQDELPEEFVEPSPTEGTEGLPPEDQAQLEDPADGRGIVPPYVEDRV